MKSHWLIFLLLSTLLVGLAYSDLPSVSKTDSERIKKVTANLKTIADKFVEHKETQKAAGKAVSSLVGSVGKLAPFLGAAGAFLSIILAFLPAQPSPELTYMKEKFAEVNRKLDQISDKLEGIEALISFEAQRAVYVGKEGVIENGYKELNNLVGEVQSTPCTSADNCQRERTKIAAHYEESFKHVEAALDLILKGCTDTSAFKDALLDLVKTKYECDVGKLTEFTESVTRLAEKGQQVIIAYHKLWGTDYSTVTSLKNWLNLVYKVRSHYYTVKNQCFDNMQTYLDKDVKQTKYQSDYGTNFDSNNALSLTLEKKYGWLKWNVLSYAVPDEENEKLKEEHAYQITDGSSNIPDNKEDRTRVIITAPVDPLGTYELEIKLKVNEAIRNWQDRTTNGCVEDKSKCVDAIVNAVTLEGLHNYIQTINVLKEELELEILGRNPNSYLDDVYQFKYIVTACSPSGSCTAISHLLTVRVVIMLRSKEMSEGAECTKACHETKSKCVRLPFSTVEECQCEAHFDGEQCLEHSKTGLSAAVESVVSSTLKIPSLVDIYYDVTDLRKELETGVTRLDEAISLLQTELKTMYYRLKDQLGQHHQWANLVRMYADTTYKIDRYAEEFRTRSKEDNDAQGKVLARTILDPQMVSNWAHRMNTLFMGETALLNEHEPILIMYMDKYLDEEAGCDAEYKAYVDKVYQQFSILQQEAYLMWMEAKSIMEQEPDDVAEEYQNVLKEQNDTLSALTCDYTISHSKTVRCQGAGHYLHPGMTLKNKCEDNYYRSGNELVQCSSDEPSLLEAPGCPACNCDVTGSSGSTCADSTGQCTCKSFKGQTYKGIRCDGLDCEWNDWSVWGACPCGYGNKKTRSRSVKITRYGTGNECAPQPTDEASCFTGCCGDQFDCKNPKKCISGNRKCNYDNDCGGNKLDEASCQEDCVDHTTTVTYGNSGGDIWFIDRQRVNCNQYGAQYVLQSFKLQRGTDDNLSYSYRCCKLHINIAPTRTAKSTSQREVKNMVYLDRFNVACPSDSFMSYFDIGGSWVDQGWLKKDKYYMKYYYWCMTLSAAKHKQRMQCKDRYTSWNSQGGKQSWYLDRHRVDCREGGEEGGRWFLQSFHLNRKLDKYIRYEYKCCRVVA